MTRQVRGNVQGEFWGQNHPDQEKAGPEKLLRYLERHPVQSWMLSVFALPAGILLAVGGGTAAFGILVMQVMKIF